MNGLWTRSAAAVAAALCFSVYAVIRITFVSVRTVACQQHSSCSEKRKKCFRRVQGNAKGKEILLIPGHDATAPV